MIALPSIAFGGFSGSAKDVTARQVGGRSILTCRTWPTGPSTNAQVARRASLKKISKSWQLLTNDQRLAWDRLAEGATGITVLGQKAKISGLNLFVRLNSNLVMAGGAMISDAPAAMTAVPGVSYSQVVVTPDLVVFAGIKHEPAPFKLVVKMSGSQSNGISSGWSKTVVVAPGAEDDWGEVDVTTLYLKTIGVEPVVGEKVFVETYWMDTVNGYTGIPYRDTVMVVADSPYQRRMVVTTDDIIPAESHVSELDMDYSTNAPAVFFDTVCEGENGRASSTAMLDRRLPEGLLGGSFALGRGMAADGDIRPQSYYVTSRYNGQKTEVTYSHRGGMYIKPSEVFGPGVLFSI